MWERCHNTDAASSISIVFSHMIKLPDIKITMERGMPMRFDSKIFRSHYGRLYFRWMYYGFAFALLLFQLIIYASLFNWNVPRVIENIAIALMSVMLIVVVPVSGFMYYDCKREAQKQQQWIDQNKVFYRVEKRKWWSFRKSEVHTLTYMVQNIKEAKISTRFFEITGLIRVADETEHEIKQLKLASVKIPRCFTNEERIMKLI